MSNRINFNAPSNQLLVTLLNRAHGSDLPVSMFSWGTPRSLTTPEQAEHGRNTEIVLTAIPESGYEGTKTIYYNRIDLGRLFRDANRVAVDAEFANSTDALAQVNTKYGLAIDPSEIVAINAMNFEVAIEITNSLVYLPGSRIVVAVGIEEGQLVDFEEAIDALWNFTNFGFPPIATTPLGDS